MVLIKYRDVSVTLIEDLGFIKITLKRAEKNICLRDWQIVNLKDYGLL